MPKLKTKKAARKRFKFTKSGKIKRAKTSRGHILTKKARKRKRFLRKSGLVDSASAGVIKKLLPYR